jgi:hypothetical protein
MTPRNGDGAMSAQKKRRAAPKKQDTALRRLLHSEEAVGLGALLNARDLSTVDALTPPGSVLDSVVRAVRRETDCPPELGIITTFAVLSAALCKSGSTYCYHDDPRSIHPALWLVALAESGAGKTFVRSEIASALNVELESIPTPASGPAYIDALAAVGGIAFWDKDEYGQTIKLIAANPTMADLKDALLNSYDHRRISNQTRKHGLIEVSHPVLVIYGATPDASFGSCIDAEMLIDGFAARHLWAPVQNCPLSVWRYNRERIAKIICTHPTIGMLRTNLAEKRQYVITEAANRVLKASFEDTVTELGDSLQRGFVRRITFAAGHYALLYHLLTQRDPSAQIGAAAARWAWRMVMYHLWGAKRALVLADPKLSDKLTKMMAWCAHARAENLSTQELVRRFTQRFSRDVSGVGEARQMLAVCGVKT